MFICISNDYFYDCFSALFGRINFAFNFHVYFARQKLLHYFLLSLYHSPFFSLSLFWLPLAVFFRAFGSFSARRTFSHAANNQQQMSRHLTRHYKVKSRRRVAPQSRQHTLAAHSRTLIAASCAAASTAAGSAKKLRKTVEKLLQNAIRKYRARENHPRYPSRTRALS